MRNVGTKILALACCFAVAPAISARAQNADDYGAEELQAFFKDVVKQYEFEPAGLKLTQRPLLHWGNAVRTQVQGGLFVWTKDGVPAVLGSVFSFRKGTEIRYKHEVASLSSVPLEASLNGRIVWSPIESAANWQEIEAQAPSTNPARRLTQMRLLARKFGGEKRERDGSLTKLSLMPQPLFRYASEKNNVIDGAIFAFAEATDPEIFLLVEAKGSLNAANWRYCVIPSNWVGLALTFDTKVVWAKTMNEELMSAYEGDPLNAKLSYFCFYSRDPLPAAETLRELATSQGKAEKTKTRSIDN